MFGLFDSDLSRVRKLRLEYEDIRQRVLYKMNAYEKYSFWSAFQALEDDIFSGIDEIPEYDLDQWRKVGAILKLSAQKSWNEARRMPGLAAESGRAGSQGWAMLALRCSAKGYQLGEALTLRSDISSFEMEIERIVNDD